MKVAIFYGSTTCYTEMAAEKIQAKLTELMPEQTVELCNLKETSLTECLNYDWLIFGISTWDYGELQEDWEATWDDLHQLDLSGKLVALYGMGDQIGYTDWFQDALGMLHQVAQTNGAHIIGYWPNQGYEFAASKALINNDTHFCGLALDDETQYQLSDERIDTWCSQLLNELTELLAE